MNAKIAKASIAFRYIVSYLETCRVDKECDGYRIEGIQDSNTTDAPICL